MSHGFNLKGLKCAALTSDEQNRWGNYRHELRVTGVKPLQKNKAVRPLGGYQMHRCLVTKYVPGTARITAMNKGHQ